MDVDQLDLSNGIAKSSYKKLLDLKPVAAGSKGVGLPYAPEDWPHIGDNWTWRVGNRKTAGGYWVDRYICPPSYFPKVSGCKARFQSRLSLEQYIRKEFPDADVHAFFASFSWKILADCSRRAELYQKYSDIEKIHNKCSYHGVLEVKTCPGSKLEVVPGGCKVGSEMCPSVKHSVCQYKIMVCDVCCNESGFCRDCCCILCCGSVDSSHGGFSFIRCQAILEEDLVCGHVAHLECALRAYMAGTVGGNIGLDVEYYCRRCDNKTDLIQHVVKIMETCESLDSGEDMEKLLNLCSCILFGSEKIRAKSLRHRIGTITSKLNLGIDLTQIWKGKNGISTLADEVPFSGKEVIMLDSPETSEEDPSSRSVLLDDAHSFVNGTCQGEGEGPSYITADHATVSAKLEDQIDHALHELKDSQASEYKTAEEKLYAQKNFLFGLYQQLRSEQGALARKTQFISSSDADTLLTGVLSRVDQIKREEAKLTQMMRIAGGFARTPDAILREYFDVSVAD